MTTKKNTQSKSTKDTSKKAETKAEKKEIVRDAWGAKEGTQVHRINAAISGTPQSAKEIAEKAQANHTATASHLRTLIGKGHIEKRDGGYCLKTAQKKATRTRKK